MKKIITVLPGILSLLLVLQAGAANYVVKELNNGTGGTFVFNPAYLQVQPGDSVTFEATDQGHRCRTVRPHGRATSASR